MNEQVHYASFSRRLAASLIDTLFLLILFIVLYALFAALIDPLTIQLVNNILPVVLVIALWLRYGGTPGKLLLNCYIVDAQTGDKLQPGQAILRYLAYFVSTIPLGLGFFWIIWHPRRQGFHDLIASTVVIHQTAIIADPLASQSLDELIDAGEK
ncbi:MAG: RDD family protein [Gammaproteobacteria bacterium]|nr:RDD family protein [Gammaproteobacteria bacterium]